MVGAINTERFRISFRERATDLRRSGAAVFTRLTSISSPLAGVFDYLSCLAAFSHNGKEKRSNPIGETCLV